MRWIFDIVVVVPRLEVTKVHLHHAHAALGRDGAAIRQPRPKSLSP